MTPERYYKLETDPKAILSVEEVFAGWHFCNDWDGLLIGPGMEELNGCTCEMRYETT